MRRATLSVLFQKRVSFVWVLVLLLSGLSPAPGARARAAEPKLPGIGDFFSDFLSDLMVIYTRWELGATQIKPDSNGNAAVGPIVLMPLPSAPGDGTPASINVTLKANQASTMPLFQWIGNKYQDGSVDPMADLEDFEDMQITFKVDGIPVVTDRNVMEFYTESELRPPVTTDLPQRIGATAWVFEQTVGIILPPLPPGKHTLTLDESVGLPDLGYPAPQVYHNTWNITVKH
jgi:hypothetical protein